MDFGEFNLNIDIFATLPPLPPSAAPPPGAPGTGIVVKPERARGE